MQRSVWPMLKIVITRPDCLRRSLSLLCSSLFVNDFHLSDVVAKHPWHKELARDPQRPREYCAGNAGAQRLALIGKADNLLIFQFCNLAILQGILDEATMAWGIKVERVEM